MFSLQYMNKDYSLSQCTKDEKAAFADTIAPREDLPVPTVFDHTP